MTKLGGDEMKLLIALSLTFMVAACGKNSMVLNHTIPSRPPTEKPTADCQNAEMGVWRLVNNEAGYDSKDVVALGNGGCAVVIGVTGAANVIHMLNALRQTSSSYSFYRSDDGKIFSNVWVQQAPMVFKDDKGKVLDSSPSEANCNTARDKLSGIFSDSASFITVIDRKGAPGPRHCYVDANFTGKDHKANFEHFIAWNNPDGNHEPFNYYLTTEKKVVYIHAVDAVQK